MSLVEEVLAEHEPDSMLMICIECLHGPWPCVPYRLATELRNAEKVVEAARKQHKIALIEWCECTEGGQILCQTAVALARYDEGRIK